MGEAIRHVLGLKRIPRLLKTLLTRRGNTTKVQKEGQKPASALRRTWTKSEKGEPACCVEKSSTTASRATQMTEKFVTNAKTAGSTKQYAEVYAIKTGNGVYVANSVLVSNCDNIGDATEIAFNMKTGSIFV